MLVEVAAELVVAELVEASKHQSIEVSKQPQERANKDSGFDKLSNQSLPILKMDFQG